MPDKAQSSVPKNGLHPRNKHILRYNFEQLVQSCPELDQYVFLNQYKDQSVDFANPNAVKMLNRALLQHFYHISAWDIPEGYLCPPVPGRADYIHHVCDLLASGNDGVIPQGKDFRVLDIGVGANCVYPIIGHHEYGWSFVGTDVDSVAIKWAGQIVKDNGLDDVIELRRQSNPSNIYTGVMEPGEFFDISICNPPFHSSLKEAELGTLRKLDNLGKATEGKPVLNFGGQSVELWYPGGEAAFISKMIYQSSKTPLQCFWYTTLVSKKDNLFAIEKALKKVGAFDMLTMNMAQGQKQSRIAAWTFLDNTQQKEWRERRWTKNV